MKKQKSTLFFILAVISLLGIGGIYFTGLFKNKPKESTKSENPNILGQDTMSKVFPTSSLDVNKFIQDTVKNTQDAASQKVSEIQKSVVTTLEKEITTLTQSQVDNLKVQICRDWGVISVTPTNKP